MNALRTLPIRIRLAAISAGLTFVILLLFSLMVGKFAGDQVRSSFDDDLRRTAADLEQRLPLAGGVAQFFGSEGVEAASSGDAVIRIVSIDGTVLRQNRAAADLGRPLPGLRDRGDYRV